MKNKTSHGVDAVHDQIVKREQAVSSYFTGMRRQVQLDAKQNAVSRWEAAEAAHEKAQEAGKSTNVIELLRRNADQALAAMEREVNKGDESPEPEAARKREDKAPASNSDDDGDEDYEGELSDTYSVHNASNDSDAMEEDEDGAQ